MHSHSRSLDLQTLKYVYEVARFGSFREAARALGLTQPALTRPIQLLERELHVVLFSRSVQGSTLTDAGKAFLDYVNQTFDDLRATQDRMREMRQLKGTALPQGTVRLASTLNLGSVHEFPLIPLLRRYLPQIKLQLLVGNSAQVEDWLKRSLTDVALLPRPAHHEVEWQRLYTDGIVVVGRRPLAHGSCRSVPLRQLSNLQLILPSTGCEMRTAINQQASREGVTLDVAVEADHPQAIAGALLDDSLHAFVLSRVRVASREFGALPFLEIESARLDIGLAIGLNYSSDNAVAEVATLLRSVFDEERGSQEPH